MPEAILCYMHGNIKFIKKTLVIPIIDLSTEEERPHSVQTFATSRKKPQGHIFLRSNRF